MSLLSNLHLGLQALHSLCWREGPQAHWTANGLGEFDLPAGTSRSGICCHHLWPHTETIQYFAPPRRICNGLRCGVYGTFAMAYDKCSAAVAPAPGTHLLICTGWKLLLAISRCSASPEISFITSMRWTELFLRASKKDTVVSPDAPHSLPGVSVTYATGPSFVSGAKSNAHALLNGERHGKPARAASSSRSSCCFRNRGICCSSISSTNDVQLQRAPISYRTSGAQA